MNRIIILIITAFFLLSCNKKYNKSNDTVIVIGAGLSGIAAAKELKDNGVKNVIVLEAQNQVGGRLKTDYSTRVPFDEGASWIHGPIGNPITDLATDAGLTTFLTNDDNAVVYDIDGSKYADATYDQNDEEFEAAIQQIEKNGSKSQSFESVFNSNYSSKVNDRFWKFMLSSWIEFDTGGDISELSSIYFYDDEAYNGADVLITDGYSNLAEHLADGLDIRLNQKVTKIDYNSKKIVVTTSTDKFEAEAVICTVPLGVLKKRKITFSPALPKNKQEAIDQLEMGQVNKFMLEWDTSFWDVDKQYIGYTSEEKGKFNFFLNTNLIDPTANALMTFAFGNYGETTESMTDQQVINEIMNHLKVIYGSNIPEPTKMLRTKWSSNEYTFGSYSFVAVGGTSKAYDAMAESVDDKLYFAGEHTSRDYRATVHGAYHSGVDSATELLKRFK